MKYIETVLLLLIFFSFYLWLEQLDIHVNKLATAYLSQKEEISKLWFVTDALTERLHQTSSQ